MNKAESPNLLDPARHAAAIDRHRKARLWQRRVRYALWGLTVVCLILVMFGWWRLLCELR